MSPAEIGAIEKTVGVRLPMSYRAALEMPGLDRDEDDHPQFITDSQLLIRENSHFSLDPEDLSEVKRPGLFGALKFWLMFGSTDRTLERRRRWHDEWVKGQRFVIGSDLGEEQYYIVLSESSPSVYWYELETRQSRTVASSVSEWLTQVRRMQKVKPNPAVENDAP